MFQILLQKKQSFLIIRKIYHRSCSNVKRNETIHSFIAQRCNVKNGDRPSTVQYIPMYKAVVG